jgi:DNA-binding MarR family transcriptional regulator
MADKNVEDRSIPFLMHQVVGRVESLVNKWAKPLGLKIEGVRVLFRLLGSDRTVNELARVTGVEISTLSRLLGRMSAMGLISRRRDAGDARSVIVSLTDKGRKMALQHHPVYFKDYEDVLFTGFTEPEAATFRRQLTQMIASLDAADEETIPGAGKAPARAASA